MTEVPIYLLGAIAPISRGVFDDGLGIGFSLGYEMCDGVTTENAWDVWREGGQVWKGAKPGQCFIGTYT